MDRKTIHNFRAEDKKVYIFGGYAIVRTPRTKFVRNVLFLSLMFLLYAFLIAMGSVTIVIFYKDSEIVEQTCFDMLTITAGSFFTPLIGLTTAGSLDLAANILVKGIDQYTDEDLEHEKIKEKRVEQVFFLCGLIKKVFILHPVLNVFVARLIKMLILTEEQLNAAPLNPLLPFPFYMPFDTRTYFGYGVAFTASAMLFFFLAFSSMCLIMTYISCAFQLVAQIEILNHSLKIIEARAYSKLKKSGTNIRMEDKKNLYQLMEYQEWLYFCLRENVLHHQNILRFKKACQPFLERVYALGFIVISTLMAVAIIILLEQPNIDPSVATVLVIGTSCYYMVCAGCQYITDKSAETIQSLYSTPWPHCNSSYKVLLKIMLPKTQELIILRAAGFNLPASLEVFAEMISGAYKIINLLRP